MTETKTTYDITDLLSVFDIIGTNMGGVDMIEYIAVTPNEFSIYIAKDVSMTLVSDILALKKEVIDIDSIFFNQTHPQLVVSNTRVKETQLLNESVISFMNFVQDCAAFICPCTGSEIFLMDNEIRIFIDQTSLLHDEYMGVVNLFKKENAAIKVVFDMQRPYISIMDWSDIKNV